MIPWYRHPQLELAKFSGVDFFPPKPNLEELKSICIGSKTRTVGDPMMLSTLPEKLKKCFPHLKVYIYPRGFNPVVFWNNPFVDGLSYMPSALYGDDCNEGEGHIIQLKEKFFSLPVSETPRASLFLTSQEVAQAKAWLQESQIRAKLSEERQTLPLLMIHPTGRGHGTVVSIQSWEKLLPELKKKFRVCQVGVEGHARVLGCDFHFLTPLARRYGRELFAMMAQGQYFIGMDSGPMHVAQAFALKSVIILDHIDADAIFKSRRSAPYYLYGNRLKGFLYENSVHTGPEQVNAEFLINALD